MIYRESMRETQLAGGAGGRRVCLAIAEAQARGRRWRRAGVPCDFGGTGGRATLASGGCAWRWRQAGVPSDSQDTARGRRWRQAGELRTELVNFAVNAATAENIGEQEETLNDHDRSAYCRSRCRPFIELNEFLTAWQDPQRLSNAAARMGAACGELGQSRR